MSLASLERDIPPGSRLLLDSSALIAYLNAGESTAPVAIQIIDEWVRRARNRAVVSVVSEMEILVRPLRHDRDDAYWTIVDFLESFPNLEVVDVTSPVARQAASLRAVWTCDPPDALIIATGIVEQATCLVTNDAHWKRVSASTGLFKVVTLGDYIPLS